jgi:phosphoglycerate dehydrogenase-like enzyme
MTKVIFAPDPKFKEFAPSIDMLRDAGFDVAFLSDPRVVFGAVTDQETIDALSGASAVMAGGERYTAKVLQGLPQLRVIARLGVGFDRIDIPAATRQGTLVTVTPNANHESVAEHAVALMLAHAKNLVKSDRAQRAGGWPKEYSRPLRTKTLGVVGLGRIGRDVAVRALAFRMSIVATELYPDQEFVRSHGIEILDLDSLLSRSDYVSLNCPLNDETHGIIDRTTLAKMKPGAVLVNTARGGLVVEADLVEALNQGHLGGAALDVFEQEPMDAGNPLLAMDNVIVSPHVAGNDTLSAQEMGIDAARSIIDLHSGRWPHGSVVNAELEHGWSW